MKKTEHVDITLIKNGKEEKIKIEIEAGKFNENKKSIYEALDKKIKDNYTAIVVLETKLGYEDNKKTDYTSEILIPKNISSEDYRLIMEKVGTFSEEEINSMTLVNYNTRNGLDDYDYYNYGQKQFIIRKEYSEKQKQTFQKINEARRPNKILDYFLRKKLDQLSDFEKEMYEDYETFNLEKLLFDNNMKYNPLSNDNCGVITIFEDKTYKSTVTKMQHKGETDIHLKNYNIDSSGIGNIDDYVNIQILKEGSVLYIPKNLNEYQVNGITSYIDELEELEKFNNKKLDVYGAIIEKSSGLNMIRECNGIEEIRDYLNTNVKQNKN